MQLRWPRFWVDNFQGFNYHLSWQERRRLVIGRIEDAGFGWWIVIVAGVGFLTDAYDIFAINTVLPMLSTIYWQGAIPLKYNLALNVSTLLGSMLGQVIFGLLADKYGRRNMYGLELVVTITASLGFASSSNGVNQSMSLIGWLIFWRIIMGIGIGADYPLSAVITAEFAPTKYRARMIAAVFFMQPVGQLLATLFAFAATEGLQGSILNNNDPSSCSFTATDPVGMDCARTLDRAWRLVSGLAAVPAAIAIIFRLTIPESVYWVLDVKNDSNQAMQTRSYWPTRLSEDGGMDGEESIRMEELTPNIGGTTVDGDLHSPRYSTIISDTSVNLHQRQLASRADSIGLGSPALHAPGSHRRASRMSYEDPHPRQQSLKDFYTFFVTEGNWTDLFATSMNWMLLDFTFYLLGVNTSRIIPDMFNTMPNEGPFNTLADNEKHTLIATSIGAILGGAIAIKIMNNFSRKNLQFWCFLILAGLFVVVGTLFVTVLHTASQAIVVVYVICQLFFNLGPNTATFIIAAEAFPTRYRCTCHGISAASGKLASAIGQLAIYYLVVNSTIPGNPTSSTTNTEKNIGYLLICFVLPMALGAAITKYWTPETCDIWGNSRTLEELSFGKKHRKELEIEERREETRTRRK